MIKGKAKLEFGTGTIAMVPCFREDGIAALCLTSVEPHEIGSLGALPKDWTPEKSQVIMTFDNFASAKALIMDLAEILRYFRNNGEMPNDYWGDKIILDFDKFLEDPVVAYDCMCVVNDMTNHDKNRKITE